MTMSTLDVAKKRYILANDIVMKIEEIDIDGVSKLKNKLKQEINFLQKCIATRSFKEEYLTCSNLTHLEAFVTQMLRCESVCCSVMTQKVLKRENGSTKKICIDLILFGGSTWMKVIARNKKALTLVSKGECSFGQKSIIDQAKEFIRCSNQNLCFYKPPTVIFFFANGIDESLAKELTDIGIKVEHTHARQEIPQYHIQYGPSMGDRSNPKPEYLNIIRDVHVINKLGIKKLNLGVTTLIAYVSALTNGGHKHRFQSSILRKHAEWEKSRPVKPILDKLFEGKNLYSCRTAVNDFKAILDILGGPGERRRGKEFLERITVVDDHPTPKLQPGGKIKERSITIFGTGEYIQALTVSANQSFVRSAKNKGVTFDVFLHESRALTEGKQLKY